MSTAMDKAKFDFSWFYNVRARIKQVEIDHVNDHGVTYQIWKDTADDDVKKKIKALTKAMKTLRKKGVAIPDSMRFYTTNLFEAQNRAFHFDPFGKAISWVTLGPTVLKGGSGTGLSSEPSSDIDKAMRICIHEIGHSIHAHRCGLEDFFKPAVANKWSGKAANASKVSQYATSSKKEFVAEVFLGLCVGKKFDKATLDEYSGLNGPPV